MEKPVIFGGDHFYTIVSNNLFQGKERTGCEGSKEWDSREVENQEDVKIKGANRAERAVGRHCVIFDTPVVIKSHVNLNLCFDFILFLLLLELQFLLLLLALVRAGSLKSVQVIWRQAELIEQTIKPFQRGSS